MAKKFQLQIPDPCHENWHKMTPVDKGRFCDSCEKAVHDFTGMSDAQLIAFFKKPSTGSVCGRFYNDQLDRDFEIPRKRIPWLKYFFQIVIPAFLFSSRATAQGEVIKVRDTIVQCGLPKQEGQFLCVIPTKGEKTDSSKISGWVVDKEGRPIPYASVIIKGTNQGVATDANGEFRIRPHDGWEIMTLVVSSVGFNEQELTVKHTEFRKQYMVALTMCNMGQVFVGLSVTKKKPTEPLIPRLFKDTSFQFFKVFPNPVAAGSSINIELMKSEPGDYKVDLVNAGAQIVYSGILNFQSEREIASFNIPVIIAGSYSVQLTNKKTRKKRVEKIIVQ